nr:MAG TPA: hypothetical protein [Bacteriophage sp.]
MAIDYNKHNWAYGEEFTPDKLNNIEGGIKANADAINEANNNLPRKLLWSGNAKAESLIYFDTTRYTQYEIIVNTGFTLRGMAVVNADIPHGGDRILTCIGSAALWTGNNYITSQTVTVCDVYDDHIYVNSIIDYASDNNQYKDFRAIIAVYGLT